MTSFISKPEMSSAPVNPVFILGNGKRVRIELRQLDTHAWMPVIEGDLAKLLPMVVGIDADTWLPGTMFKFPKPAGLDDDQARAWTRRLLDNSPILRPGSQAVTKDWAEGK